MAVPHRIGEAADPGLSGPVRALPWADQALCAVHPEPNIWFPERSASVYPDSPENRAKAICGYCPVLEQCREYAMSQPRLQGIWGAMTSNERRQARRKERGWA